MRALFVLCLIACGSREAKQSPPPSPPPPAITAAPVPAPAIDAAVLDAAPAFTAVDPKSLPEWTAAAGKGPTVEIYAVDMDAAWLVLLLTRQTWIAPVTPTKRLTGRISGPREAVVATLAREAGIDLGSPKLGGRGEKVDIQFVDVPSADLLRFLGYTGRVNIVTSGELPNVHIRARNESWEGVMNAIAKLAGSTVVASGNTRYLVEQVPLPPLPKVASKARVSFDINNGTAAHAIAALRTLTPVVLGAACGGKPFTLRARDVTLAEALRAITFASGATLAGDATCESAELIGGPLEDVRLVAVAQVGTKRAAVFDRAGKVLTATRGGIVTDIGDGFVTFTDLSVQLHPSTAPRDLDKPIAPRRALALVHDGHWSGYVDTDSGIRAVDPKYPPHLETRVGLDGVHFADGTSVTLATSR